MKPNLLFLILLLIANIFFVSNTINAQTKNITNNVNIDSVSKAKRLLWLAKLDSISVAKKSKSISKENIIKGNSQFNRDSITIVKKTIIQKPVIISSKDSIAKAKRTAWIAKQDSIDIAKKITVPNKKTVSTVIAKPNTDSIAKAKRTAWIAKQDSIAIAKKITVPNKKTVSTVIAKPNTDSIAKAKRTAWIAKQDAIAIAKKITVPNKKTVSTIIAKPNTDSIAKAKRTAWIAKQDSVAIAKKSALPLKKSELSTIAKPNKDSISKAKRALWIAKQDSVSIAKKSALPLKKSELSTIAKPNTDSIAKAKRALWIAKQDSVAIAKKSALPLKKSELSTIAKPNKDSIAKAKRTAWIAKQDSIAIAKKSALPLKKSELSTIAKPNKDSIAKAKRALWIIKRDSISAAKKISKNKNKIKNKTIDIAIDSVKFEVDTFIVKSVKIKNNDFVNTNEAYISNYGADEMIMQFSNEEFDKVIKNSKPYLSKFPLDTNIIIKTGLSYLFSKKYKQGFEMIDASFVNKDSLIQFYSVLPFINFNAKDDGVYEQILKHCRELQPNNIWTYFTAATMFNTRGNLDSAFYFSKLTLDNITNEQDANSLGYFYPTVLYQNGYSDSAIEILKKTCNQYPNNLSLDFNLVQMLKKEKRWSEAFIYIDKIVKMDKSNEDYFQEKLDICIAMKNNTEACNMLAEVNTDYSYDEKIFKAHCSSEFAYVPFQHQSTFTWKINQKGESFTINGIVDASIEGKIKFDFTNTGKASNHGYFNINSSSFDTCRTIDATFFNITKNTDSNGKLIVWISKLCYQEIENSGQTILDIGTGLAMFTVVNTIDEDDANIFMDRIIMKDGSKKLIETYHLINSETNEQIWILKNKANPLIVKMDGIYTMELSAINN
jgi:tetratricopeptide (TPR) repeat protein